MRLIDADEVLEQIRKKLGIKSLDYLLEAERQIVDAIQSAPSIEPKRGEWIECDVNDTSGYWKCSACGRSTAAIVARAFYNFCPYCGARMKGADDEMQ